LGTVQNTSNSSRNTIYSTDGVRSPRPTLSETEKITATIIDVKTKAEEAGRIGIEVVYGKESHVDPQEPGTVRANVRMFFLPFICLLYSLFFLFLFFDKKGATKGATVRANDPLF